MSLTASQSVQIKSYTECFPVETSLILYITRLVVHYSVLYIYIYAQCNYLLDSKHEI